MSRLSSLSAVFAACSITSVVPLLAQGPPPRVPYASACGAEVHWERDHARALERAKQERKPIFWYVPTALGTPMDRRQELHWVQRGGMYSDPAVVELLNEHFVPLELGFVPLLDRGGEDGAAAVVPKSERKALAERYGLSAPQFIEPGFVLLDANGALVHTCDRLGVYENAWFAAFLARIFEAHRDALFGEAEPPRMRALHECLPANLAPALRKLHAGDYAAAEELFAAGEEHSARLFFRGACLHVLGRGAEGDEIWRKAIARLGQNALWPGESWCHKAQLELDRWGPFLYGYERFEALPPGALEGSNLRTTANGAPLEPKNELVLPALEFLLEMPRSRGLYRDSRYDFGGLDSMPNVHVAVSALAAQALLEWRAIAPQRIDPVLEELRAALADEEQIAGDDADEIVWAHAARALFFARSIELEPKRASAAKAKLEKIVAELASSQLQDGGWRHEYPAAFTTAFVLYALHRAAQHGVEIAPEKLASAGEALARVRGEGSTWPYAFGRPAKQPVSSACRAPWCELGLYVTKRSSAERLQEALSVAFQHHDPLAAVRRYDDHADRYGHGGFFFWFDMLGRAVSSAQLEAPQRERFDAQLTAQIASMREVDGTWIDSPEVGKVYGTACALLCLAIATR